jgi:hypothetical protein
MNNNNPKPISNEEWKELMAVPAIRDAWGIEDDESPEQFAKMVYGAKFNFQSGGPGYVGDLFILQGDELSNEGPVLLKRDSEGKLEIV